VVGTPVQIQGAEHYVESHTAWGCAAAPVHDPWTGETLGVVDVSGPSQGMHPSALTMVQLAARVAELEVRQQRLDELEALRNRVVPLVARVGGRVLVVDRYGHTAVALGVTPPERVALPEGMGPGNMWVPTLGAVTVDALPGGWLLRLDPEEAPATAAGPVLLTLDLTAESPSLRVQGSASSWTHAPTPRHTEILVALITQPNGRSAAELALDLFADAGRVVTVRAEMSRLRRILGSLLRRQPYRFDEAVKADLVLPANGRAVLTGSSAPVVSELRASCR
jgi:hypothetical protein